MTPRIVLEDPDFLVVEKPEGLSTQPLRSGGSDSLARRVAEDFPEIKKIGGADWGAVHRLDRETSGLVVFARNEETYRRLREMFSKNEVDKEYTARVEVKFAGSKRIEWPIGPDSKTKKKVKVYRNPAEARRNKAQEATTLVEPLGNGLLRVTIKTGRRHQIRAHLAAIGHPILGDTLYEGPEADRLHLHASRLRFRHPRGRGWVEASSPAPFA